ncbi:maleate cis-trans isomerase [Gordonia sp. HY442]|uniref:maleate cis-trans isomerase family protein n=1 Tax=Gordonia zhenghanii TaxID=2911516 RepID=UPI001F48B5CF|nr:maleate cis-trans isomerase [Gordonia zhenghanii]MCF8607613.1 maleate cis-trans isomerase [Gordonia zhenghanii]
MSHRIGLIVPSSNVTVESEMPQLLNRHPSADFTFHSSRMRMHAVTPEGLAVMNAQRERCVREIGDASVDAVLYACLVAIMAAGNGEHERTETEVAKQLTLDGIDATVLSSAGALPKALHDLGARRVALVMPYSRPLAERVVAYMENEGFDIADWRALEVSDNSEVSRIPGDRVMAAARDLDLDGVDALVLSCCVQMPSLPLIHSAEQEFGLPVLSAATAGAYTLLRRLGLPVTIPQAGSLLHAD